MILKKNRFKPLFKQIIKLRGNFQNRNKLSNFKREKWKTSIDIYKRKTRSFRNYRKFRPYNIAGCYVTRYANKGTAYKKKFRDKLNIKKSLRMFYGNILNKKFKNRISKISKSNCLKMGFLASFETRLDILLYRARFSNSVRGARQFITHGKIYVNGLNVKNKSYQIKAGDLISFKPKNNNLYRVSAVRSLNWPLPPKYLLVNFRTMQILFLGNINRTTLSVSFLLYFRLQKILTNHF